MHDHSRCRRGSVRLRRAEDGISDRVVQISLQVSHHGSSAVEGTVSWLWLPPMTMVGLTDLHSALQVDGSHVDGPTISVKPFHISDVVTITAELPAGADSGRMCLVFSEEGTVLAAAVVDVCSSRTAQAIGLKDEAPPRSSDRDW